MKKLLCLTLLFIGLTLQSQVIPERVPSSYVHDYSKVMSTTEINSLNNTLFSIKNEYRIETAIVIVDDLQGYDLSDYALKLGRSWGVGDKTNNGLVILVAIKDRKWTIQVGQALQGFITDVESKNLATQYMVPKLKEEEYYEAFNNLILKIRERFVVNKEEIVSKKPESKNLSSWLWVFVIILIGAPLIIWILISNALNKDELIRLEKSKEETQKKIKCAFDTLFNSKIADKYTVFKRYFTWYGDINIDKGLKSNLFVSNSLLKRYEEYLVSLEYFYQNFNNYLNENLIRNYNLSPDPSPVFKSTPTPKSHPKISTARTPEPKHEQQTYVSSYDSDDSSSSSSSYDSSSSDSSSSSSSDYSGGSFDGGGSSGDF